MPDQAVLAEAYEEAESDEYVEEEAGQRATARGMLERIERHVPERGAILDLGCWVGFLLAEARQRGWQVTGVEPSQFASDFARQRLGLSVVTSDLFSASLDPGSFDAVTMNDVIEHLIDPGEALDHVHGLLRGGGILSLALPDAGSAVARTLGKRWWSVLPTHVQYFTRNSMVILLQSHGFQVLEVSTAPKAFTVRYYLNRISGYSGGLGRALVAAATSAGVADRMWTPDFRDRMAVIARAV
ncbi:MAG: class I SAM-dependent methyltransferase [Solirubrobacteraceae bacterium]